jgi:lipoate-protein ligase A
MRNNPPYRLVRSTSSAADFHTRAVPNPASCEIWCHEITSPALVMGSSQLESVADRIACERAGVDVVRRRSGGGAVLLLPGEVTWIDVIVPADSRGWTNDVHGQMIWLGRCIADAIALHIEPGREVVVHDEAMRSTAWSSLLCFDGVGAGEVLLDGCKLVGISQRRTRHAARLQCCWYSTYDPFMLVELLAPELRPPLDELSPIATVSNAVSDGVVATIAATLGSPAAGRLGADWQRNGEEWLT